MFKIMTKKRSLLMKIGLIAGLSICLAVYLFNSDSEQKNVQLDSANTSAKALIEPLSSANIDKQPSMNLTLAKTKDRLSPDIQKRSADANTNKDVMQKSGATCVDLEKESESDPLLETEFSQFATDIGLSGIGVYNEYAHYDDSALQTMAEGGDRRAMYALGLYYAWYPDYHSRALNDFSQPQSQTLQTELSPVERLDLAEQWLMKAAHEGFVFAFTELEFVIRDRQIYQMNTPQDQALQSPDQVKPVLPPYSNFVKWAAPDYEQLGLHTITIFSSKEELTEKQQQLLNKMKRDWSKQRQAMGRDIKLKLNPSENVRQLLMRLTTEGPCRSK
jgi:hypothetical protein